MDAVYRQVLSPVKRFPIPQHGKNRLFDVPGRFSPRGGRNRWSPGTLAEFAGVQPLVGGFPRIPKLPRRFSLKKPG